MNRAAYRGWWLSFCRVRCQRPTNWNLPSTLYDAETLVAKCLHLQIACSAVPTLQARIQAVSTYFGVLRGIMQNGIKNLLRCSALICMGSLAYAQNTTTISVTNVNGLNMGGIYTSPYYGMIGADNSIVKVICDDFADDTYITTTPETWTAYVNPIAPVTFPSGVNTELRFTTGTGVTQTGSTYNVATGALNQSQAYTTAAILATEMVEQDTSTSAGQLAQEELSYALWGLFDPAALSTTYLGANLSDTQAYLYQAEQTASGLDPGTYSSVTNSTVTIYSYVPGSGTLCGNQSCPPPPQEFLSVTMPEPYSPAMLGVDFLAAAGLVVLFRRRRQTTAVLR